MSVIGAPSLASAAGLSNGIPHMYRWFETDASKKGANYFDEKYGSGSAAYTTGNAMYFDINSFITGYPSAYVNPRTGTYNIRPNATSGAKSSYLDYLIPILTISFIPLL